jgi:hypothetical protein
MTLIFSIEKAEKITANHKSEELVLNELSHIIWHRVSAEGRQCVAAALI